MGGATLALAGSVSPSLVVLGVGIGIAAGACFYDRRFALLAVAVLGAMYSTQAADRALQDRLAPALAGKTLEIVGRIATIPRREVGRIRFEVELRSGKVSAVERPVPLPRKIVLSWYRPPHGLAPRAGEVWRFAVRLRRPRSRANPGGFDYAGWALAHGIGAGGYIYHNRATRLAGAAGGLLEWRERLARAIRTALPDNPAAGLVTGLAVGERGGVSQAQWATLRATGTTHLLAISGLHLGLIAALVFFLARGILRRAHGLVRHIPVLLAAAVLAWLAALGYAALAGFGLPTRRALVMLALPLVALMLRRRVALGDALGLAAFVVTLFAPLAVITASFWLSFGAVAALLYGLASARSGRGLVRAQLVVSLGLIPLVGAFFGQISLIGPVANLLAVPVVGWLVVPFALLGIMATLLHPGWGEVFFRAAAWGLRHLFIALDWLAHVPHATFAIAPVGGWVLAAAILGAVALLAPRGLGVRLAGAALCLPLLWPVILKPPIGGFFLTVFDVGQGSAVAIQTARHVVLVDSGPAGWRGRSAGSEILLPYFAAYRLEKPSLILISHANMDHAGGLSALAAAWPEVPVFSSAPGMGRMCRAGQRWTYDKVDFLILSPPATSGSSGNNRSCVLKVGSSGGSVLIPGDIERGRERWLVTHARRALGAEVLIAPHHGSATSSTPAFIAAVHPRFVIFTTGYHNRYGFPRQAVLARYGSTPARRLNTAYTGALRFEVAPGKGVRLRGRYRLDHRRPWTDP